MDINVKTNSFTELSITHTIDFPDAALTYTAGREKSTGKTRLFLIFQKTGRVYSRNGRINSWDEVVGDAVQTINSLATAVGVPYFQSSGIPELLLQ